MIIEFRCAVWQNFFEDYCLYGGILFVQMDLNVVAHSINNGEVGKFYGKRHHAED